MTFSTSATNGGTIGNMTSKSEGGTTVEMGYSSEHIHAPASHTGSSSNTYDNNGNSSSIGGDIHYYDVENRLSQINAWTNFIYFTTFMYDGSGEMARRKVRYAVELVSIGDEQVVAPPIPAPIVERVSDAVQLGTAQLGLPAAFLE